MSDISTAGCFFLFLPSVLSFIFSFFPIKNRAMSYSKMDDNHIN